MLSTFIVRLLRDNETIGLGLVMPDIKNVHGYQITTGWKAVNITTLFVKNLECWNEYPTGSGIIEEGSFSAWPDDRLEYFTKDKGETNDSNISCVPLRTWLRLTLFHELNRLFGMRKHGM